MTQHDNTTKAVLRKLLNDHVGRENSITQAQLAEALDLNPSTLRSELRRLREQRDLPIGNLRDGYFVIGDREELQEYVAHINQEIDSKRRTIEHTTEAFATFDPDDASVPTPAADEPQEPRFACDECGRETLKSDIRRPKDGERKGEKLCKSCYGHAVIAGEA